MIKLGRCVKYEVQMLCFLHWQVSTQTHNNKTVDKKPLNAFFSLSKLPCVSFSTGYDEALGVIAQAVSPITFLVSKLNFWTLLTSDSTGRVTHHHPRVQTEFLNSVDEGYPRQFKSSKLHVLGKRWYPSEFSAGFWTLFETRFFRISGFIIYKFENIVLHQKQ